MRSYGTIDSAWNAAKIRSMLEDASNLCSDLDTPVGVGLDWERVVVSDSPDEPFLISICHVVKPAVTEEMNGWEQNKIDEHMRREFRDDDRDRHYTIDEIMPRVLNFLIHGIKRYGRPNFQEGRNQVWHASIDAHNLINLHKNKKPFVLGYSDGELTVAPMSETGQFVALLSCIVSTDRCWWSISDMHSDRLLSYLPECTDMCEELSRSMVDRARQYGIFDMIYERCVPKLESAIEDAARLAASGEPCAVGLVADRYGTGGSYYDMIMACSKESRLFGCLGNRHILVRQSELWDGQTPDIQGIRLEACRAFQTLCGVHEARRTAKPYGKLDSSWDDSKFRSLLQDASRLARIHGMSFKVGEDKDGNASIIPNFPYNNLRVFACGVSVPEIGDFWKDRPEYELRNHLEEEFWDNVGYVRYTVDEMVPRIRDCLTRGIIKYGSLEFLSEGRYQLARALSDAQKMQAKYSRPFVLGMTEEEISVAPLSDRYRFVDPLLVIVTKHGEWSVSDTHYRRLGRSSSYANAVDRLYLGMAYGHIDYGRFRQGQDCMVRLENAFEDAAKLAAYSERRRRHNAEKFVLSLSADRIGIRMKRDRLVSGMSIDIVSDGLWNNTELSHEKIRESAAYAYEQFARHLKASARADKTDTGQA